MSQEKEIAEKMKEKWIFCPKCGEHMVPGVVRGDDVWVDMIFECKGDMLDGGTGGCGSALTFHWKL